MCGRMAWWRICDAYGSAFTINLLEIEKVGVDGEDDLY